MVTEAKRSRRCDERWIEEIFDYSALKDSTEYGGDRDWSVIRFHVRCRSLGNWANGGVFPLIGKCFDDSMHMLNRRVIGL